MDLSSLSYVKSSRLTATLSFLSEDEATHKCQCVEIEGIEEGQNLYTPES